MKWSPAFATDVPTPVVTVTSTTPGVRVAGEFAVIVVEFTTTTPVAAVDPKATVAPGAKFVPEMVTAVPPPESPLFGLTDVTVGMAKKVNWSAGDVADVPPVVVTVTSTVPVPAGDVAVIDVGEATVKPAFVAPNLTAVAPVKLLPEIVTAVPPAAGPLPGLTAVTEGGVVVPPQVTTIGVEAAWAFAALAFETNPT